MRGYADSIDHGYSRAYGWATPAPSEEEDAARSLMMLGNQSRAASSGSPEQIHKANLIYSSEIEEEPCDSDSTEMPEQQKQQQLQRDEYYRQQQYHQRELARQQQAHYHQQTAQTHHHQHPHHHHHRQPQPQPMQHQHYPVQHQSQSHGPLSSPIAYTKKAKKMSSSNSNNNRFDERNGDAYASDCERHDGYRSETVKGEKDTDYVDDARYETHRSMIVAPKRKPSQSVKKRSTQKPTQRKPSTSSSKGGMAPPKLHSHLPAVNLEAEFDAPPAKVRKTNNSAITSLPSPISNSMAPPPLAN